MRIDHTQLEILHARARRERAEAVYTLLIAPLVRLFSRRPRAAARPAANARHAAA